MKFHSPCAHCSNIFFFFFFKQINSWRNSFPNCVHQRLQTTRAVSTAGSNSWPLQVPALTTTFFFFFFPVGGKNINNKNVIGNCCHLQKKWRNEAQTFLSGITGTPFLRTELCVWGCTAWAVKS